MKGKKEIRCPNKAKYLYSWNGKLIKGCEGHSKVMKAIGEAMGGYLSKLSIYIQKKIVCMKKISKPCRIS